MSHDEGLTCACRRTHAPHPLELHIHHIWPLALGGPDTAENRVPLCLAPGSQVLMADGSEQAIETVRLGAEVMGYDGMPAGVTAVTRSWFDGHLVTLDGLAVTPTHPVLTPLGWTEAQHVRREPTVLSEPLGQGVDGHVLSLIRAEPQIRGAVVEGVEVDVVDDFHVSQAAAQQLLHHQPVLDDVPRAALVAPDGHDAVTASVVPVSEYAYALAVEGYRRWREGSAA